jgi:flagellar hook-associated protein 1
MSTASLSNALLIATSGLRAAQSGIDAVTRNVSNAQVEGYSRKEVPLESVVFGDINGGVRAGELQRFVSEALLRQLRDSTSTSERLAVEDDFLGRFEQIFGKPGDQVSMTYKIGTLSDAFRGMTVSPDLSTNQLKVIDAAQSIVQNFTFVSSNIRRLREEADAALSVSVDKVNAALVEIADLNLKIATLQSQGKSSAELEDKRDLQINAVSKEIDITYFKLDSGQMTISTKSGLSLLDVTFDPTNPPMSFNKTPVILPTNGYVPPPSSEYGGLGGVMLNGIDISADITGGHLKGYLNLRDTYLPQTQSQLDELAARLIQNYNFQDLQLFSNGTLNLPANSAVQAAVTTAATGVQSTIQIQDVSNLSVGMSLKFGSHDTIYQITGLNTATNEVTFAQVSSTTGLTQDVAINDTVMFGPAVPQVINQTARTTGQGALAASPIEMTGLVGLQVGARIKFANHDTIYTVTAIGTADGLASDQQFLIQPDGLGLTGLQASIAAGEGIQVMPPVSGVAGLSSAIRVNPTIINNPWRTRDGTRRESPSELTGDNTLVTNIVSMFEELQSFSINTGLTSSATLEGFATAMIAFEANRRSATQTQFNSQTVIKDNFDRRVKDESGVNIDQELAFMLQVQNSYSASARTIAAVKEMLDELINIVR